MLYNIKDWDPSPTEMRLYFDSERFTFVTQTQKMEGKVKNSNTQPDTKDYSRVIANLSSISLRVIDGLLYQHEPR